MKSEIMKMTLIKVNAKNVLCISTCVSLLKRFHTNRGYINVLITQPFYLFLEKIQKEHVTLSAKLFYFYDTHVILLVSCFFNTYTSE